MIFSNKTLKIRFLIFLLYFLLIFPVTCYSATLDDSENLDQFDLENLTQEASSFSTTEPILNAKNAIVLERNSGRILYGKSEYQKTPMASTTKIATALVVLQNENNLNKLVSVSKKAASIGGSRLGLKENDKITIRDLLFGLMLCSGNDAAICLAENISGSVENFISEMNLLAKNLNLNSTSFTSPHGLDNENHFTTAYDLSLLTDYALSNSYFAKLVKTQNTTVYINSSPKQIKNTNELLGYFPGVYGVKTGFTNNAGRCLVTAVKQNNLDIITVVLGCDSKKLRTLDSLKLIKYIFSNFELYNIESKLQDELKKLQNNFTKNISIEKSNSIPVFKLVYQTTDIPLTKDEYLNLNFKIESISKLSPETLTTIPIGFINISSNNLNLKTIPIYLENKLLPKKISDYFLEFFKNFREIYNRRTKTIYLIHNLLKICE